MPPRGARPKSGGASGGYPRGGRGSAKLAVPIERNASPGGRSGRLNRSGGASARLRRPGGGASARLRRNESPRSGKSQQVAQEAETLHETHAQEVEWIAQAVSPEGNDSPKASSSVQNADILSRPSDPSLPQSSGNAVEDQGDGSPRKTFKGLDLTPVQSLPELIDRAVSWVTHLHAVRDWQEKYLSQLLQAQATLRRQLEENRDKYSQHRDLLAAEVWEERARANSLHDEMLQLRRAEAQSLEAQVQQVQAREEAHISDAKEVVYHLERTLEKEEYRRAELHHLESEAAMSAERLAAEIVMSKQQLAEYPAVAERWQAVRDEDFEVRAEVKRLQDELGMAKPRKSKPERDTQAGTAAPPSRLTERNDD